ncbi:hypothetical protein [Roseibium limicola]|uniref:Uncharacterized protein n=1 Tax=Roseibium limicola TaxID=2816037 RepID=A0A939EL26_9HYPH|nr:hypothetical protein [Roseibium limicola]MBO0344549.1 hypothetical protein [Roseibium limicola]
MSPSLVGVIGAILGAYLGWVDAKILTGILGAMAEKKKGEGAEGSLLVRYRGQIKALVFVGSMVGFPMIGYWAGVSLAG